MNKSRTINRDTKVIIKHKERRKNRVLKKAKRAKNTFQIFRIFEELN